MEFEKIILLTINGLSFIILLILFVLFLLERKKVKEKLTEESMRLEKIINEYYEQTDNKIKALKSELEKMKQDVANSVEQLSTEFISYRDGISKNFETLKFDIQNIGQDFENRIENLNKQMNESYNQLNIKVNKLEKLLKEPIDIEEWINESDR